MLVLEKCILNLQQVASAVNLGPVHWVQRTLNFNYQAVPSLTFPPQFLSSLRLILGSINFICRKLKCNFDLKNAAWPVAYFFLNGFVFVIKSNAGKWTCEHLFRTKKKTSVKYDLVTFKLVFYLSIIFTNNIWLIFKMILSFLVKYQNEIKCRLL